MLAEEMQKLIVRVQRVAQETDERILQAYPHIPLISDEEFGDERAKDLIDRGVAQSNPKKAIKLFQKALSYGQKGIQASKAYLCLAMVYEDEGDIAQAIEYYTQAIQAWKEPTSMMYFWRGRLYYQQGQWERARHDFKSALAFPPEEKLFSPEYQQAQEFLKKIEASAE